MNWASFQYKGKEHRVVGRTVKSKTRGYVGEDATKYNVLQVRRGGIARVLSAKCQEAWKDVEFEEVPGFVTISLGALGYADWESKMMARIMEELQ
jgi:hypothetical protein